MTVMPSDSRYPDLLPLLVIYRPGSGINSEHVAEYLGASAPVVLLLLHDFPDPGKSHRFPCSSPRTHDFPIFCCLRAWRIVTRVSAAADAGRSAFRAFFSSLIRAFTAGLACFYGDGPGGLGTARLQGGGGGVPGEGDLVLAQVPDHLAPGWQRLLRRLRLGCGAWRARRKW